MRFPFPSLLAVALACTSVATEVPEVQQSPAAPSAPPRPAAVASTQPVSAPVEEERPAQAPQDDSCAELANVRVVTEPGGPKKHFSVHGYAARSLRLEREGAPSPHCILVAWPAGDENTAGQRVTVASRIRQSWLRLLENTLARIPWHHATLVRRLVIDDRPTEHGIAPFDRKADDDARDGHTIWLHHHLFAEPNHWARGNHGSYWSYHLNEDGRTAHAAPEDHDLFSPVLLHEIGHLVMYHLVNGTGGVEGSLAPACAHTCVEANGCAGLAPDERERNCISPYCRPFKFATSTENWAEQYRFYFQSSRTRQLLAEADSKCLELLHEHDHGAAPWLSGKPDIANFRPSRWQSCGGRACKSW